MGRSSVRLHRWCALGADAEHAAHRSEGRHAGRALAALAIALAACGARSDLGGVGDEQPGAGGVGQGGGHAAEEICNGVDDDLDGQVDEGLGEISCGAGACGQTIPACASGVPATCPPLPAEVCNGLDDDCDGVADEGLSFVRKSGPHVVFASPLTEPVQGDLEATETGFLLAFSRGLNLAANEANLFLEPLDPQGALSSEVGSLPEVKISLGPRLTPGPAGFFASYCRRSGSGDRAASALISGTDFDSLGNVPPGGNACLVGTPDAVWTGERFLYVFIDSVSNEVILARADANGEWLSNEPLVSNADPDWYPRLARSGATTLVAFGSDEGGQPTLGLTVLDALGDPLASIIGATDDPGELVEAVPTQDNGFQLFFLQTGAGVNRLEAFPGGATGFGKVSSIAGLDGAVSLRVVAGLAGGALLAGTKGGEVPRGFAARVDDHGIVTAYYETSQDPEIADRRFDGPMLADRGDSVVVGYTRNVGSDASVETVELGCIEGE